MISEIKSLLECFPRRKTHSTKLVDALCESMGSESIHAPHPGMWMRSSGLPYVCPRMYALSRFHQDPIENTVDSELAWIFGTGTAIHSHWQQEYLVNLGDVFQGWWRSPKGELCRGDALTSESLTHSWIPRPSSECEYVELEFRNEALRLTGHCDGILKWPDQTEVLELKTISDRGFDYVNGLDGYMPRAEHVMQVHAYLLFTGLERARIVYISKDLNKPMREGISEHEIMRDDKIIRLISELLEKCISALDHPIDNLTPLEAMCWLASFERLPDCKTKKSRRAIDCAMKGHCFRGDSSCQ